MLKKADQCHSLVSVTRLEKNKMTTMWVSKGAVDRLAKRKVATRRVTSQGFDPKSIATPGRNAYVLVNKRMESDTERKADGDREKNQAFRKIKNPRLL